MNKKCKYCAMEIPSAAKICPYCRKTQGWTLPAKIVGFVIGSIVLGGFISSFNDHPATTPSTARSAPPGTPSAAASSAQTARRKDGRRSCSMESHARFRTH